MPETEEMMGVDLKGRVQSLKLADSRALLPLFEAVVNSIHAIEDAEITDGKIEIEIDRETTFLNGTDGFIPQITGFKIKDNGIGFDDKNYTSFKKAHTTLKEARGSKGIGRFLWLKAFNDVQIESITTNDKISYFKRAFSFNQQTEKGINQHSFTPISEKVNRKTLIQLSGYKDRYKSKCPKKSLTIAKRLIEHCIVYLLQETCPAIELIDQDETTDLNSYFRKLTFGNKIEETFEIGGHQFKITILKWYEHEEINSHQLRLCAHHRDVEEISLKIIFPDLNGKIIDQQSEEEFFIVAYLESTYLDHNINEERTDFTFGRGSLFDDILELIPKDTILKEVEGIIIKNFGDDILQFTETKINYITHYIEYNLPQYRYLINHKNYLADMQISESMGDSEVELKLFKAQQNFELDSKNEVNDLMLQVSSANFNGNLKEKYDEILGKVSELNKAKLATYVIHRKTIINILERSLGLNDEGKYELEKTIHGLVCPMKITSDDIDYIKQNLWIIDERLSYHTFLSSDKPLNSVPGFESKDEDRPDLFVYNNPFSFAEGDPPFNSVVLVEFKRPMRNTYDDFDENPINQLFEYVKKIRTGKEIKKNGRIYPINEHTRFYIYLISDPTRKLNDMAEYAGLEKTFDGLGYFGYNKPLKCIVEIISFEQMLLIAKKRNAALFDHLGI